VGGGDDLVCMRECRPTVETVAAGEKLVFITSTVVRFSSKEAECSQPLSSRVDVMLVLARPSPNSPCVRITTISTGLIVDLE